MAFTQISVSGTFQNSDGSAASGGIRFTPTAVMRNATATTEINARTPVHAQVVNGVLSAVTLAATTDPGTTPTGVLYEVAEFLTGQPHTTYYIVVEHDGGAISLNTHPRIREQIPNSIVVPTPGPAGPAPTLTVGSVTSGPAPDFDLTQTSPGVYVVDVVLQPGVTGAGSVDSVNGDPGPNIVLGPSDITSGLIDIRDEGAAGNSTTDDSDAFQAAFADYATSAVTLSGLFGSNRRGTREIRIPAGTYLVTEPGALMSNLGVGRTSGLTIRGAGRSATTIVFSPGTANQYLLDNQDDYLGITFEDLSFHSTVATASFMRSVSDGGAQNYVFSRVDWTGTWKYGIDLQGSNNNSEMTWLHCGIYNEWDAYLYAGASGTSDQFLNYTFIATQVETETGDFVDMAKGGNINVVGGSLIHIGDGTSTTSSEQCFFRLRGGDHASGVERLKVVGARVEHRHTGSLLIDCEWKKGFVSFDNVETDATSFIGADADDVVQAEFGAAGNEITGVSFRDCVLLGRHRYHFSTSSYAYRKAITYSSCTIVSFPSAAQFVDIVNDTATGNTGSAPPIVFEQCRGSDNTERFDCTLNWQLSTDGSPTPRTLSIKQPWSALPSSAAPTVTLKLPINAAIIRARAMKGPSGSSSSTNFTYTLTDGDATVIAVGQGDGTTPWSAGFVYDSGPIFRFCDTDNRRTLTLTSANIDQGQPNAFFLVEYLA